MYHDTFADGDVASSGRVGVGPDLYKVDLERFRSQMQQLRENYGDRLASVFAAGGTTCPLFVTFDDGGVSAYTQAAAALEEFGIVGHFFVTTQYIGTPGFVNEQQIRELDARGHVIGTHSDSHPDIITDLNEEQLQHEWNVSTRRLQDILGKPVEVGSIPGGEYSKQVVRAASQAGVRYLFTSEPVKRTWNVEDCLAIGRYTILQHTSDASVVSLASDTVTPCQRRQARSWYAKKLVKKAFGPLYLVIREKLLSRQQLRPEGE